MRGGRRSCPAAGEITLEDSPNKFRFAAQGCNQRGSHWGGEPCAGVPPRTGMIETIAFFGEAIAKKLVAAAELETSDSSQRIIIQMAAKWQAVPPSTQRCQTKCMYLRLEAKKGIPAE